MLENSNNNKNLQCVYCKKKVTLNELLQVDLLTQNRDSEETEFIWDQLPNISLEERKNEKFLHMSNLGYKVLNVCMECYQKAIKKFEGDLK